MSDFIKKNKSNEGRLLPKKNKKSNGNNKKDKTYKYLEELQEKTIREFQEKEEMHTKIIRDIIGSTKVDNPVLSEENMINNPKERNEYIMNKKLTGKIVAKRPSNNINNDYYNTPSFSFKAKIKNAFTGEVIKEFGKSDTVSVVDKNEDVSEHVNKAPEDVASTKIEDIEAVVAPDIENRIKDPVEKISESKEEPEESSIDEEESEENINSDEYLTMDDFVNASEEDDDYDFEFDDDDEESSNIDPTDNPMGE